MGNILDCINAFEKLLDKKYIIVLGRKNVSVELTVTFCKKDCYHLMGLQYLTDRPELFHDREKVFDAIKEGKIKTENLESSDFYHKIEDRVNFFPLLEDIIDSNDTIFKYNNRQNIFSVIKADYLMKNEIEGTNVYVFLAKNDGEIDYYCRSFFPEQGMDYTRNQPAWSLLYKEKIIISTGEKEILFDKLKKY